MEFQKMEQNDTEFLVYTIDSDKEIDTVTQGMLLNNQIKGILPAEFSEKDNNLEYSIEISDLQVLTDIYEKVIRKQGILSIFLSTAETIINAKNYMIPEEEFVLMPEYIYIDISNGQTALICLPFKRDEKDRTTLASCLLDVLENITADPREPLGYVLYLKDFLKQGNHSTEEILEMMKRIFRNEINIPEKPVASPKQKSILAEKENEIVEAYPVKKEIPGGIRTLDSLRNEAAHSEGGSKVLTLEDLMNGQNRMEKSWERDKEGSTEGEERYPETGVLNEGLIEDNPKDPEQETGILVADGESQDEEKKTKSRKRAYLIRLSTGEKVDVVGKEFVLGRSEEQADYAITNNKWISNVHASILMTDGGCFIRDLGSMNHTYVNDMPVSGRTEKRIPDQAVIRLGNERFQFVYTGEPS